MSPKRFPRADPSGAEDIPIRTSADEEADTNTRLDASEGSGLAVSLRIQQLGGSYTDDSTHPRFALFA